MEAFGIQIPLRLIWPFFKMFILWEIILRDCQWCIKILKTLNFIFVVGVEEAYW